MDLLNRITFFLFSKPARLIRSKDEIFSIEIPNSYRFIESKGLYQIYTHDIWGFLFQISSFSLPNGQNYDVDKVFEIELKTNPNAEIQSSGKYEGVCCATISEDKNEVIYTWTFGYLNKGVLITL